MKRCKFKVDSKTEFGNGGCSVKLYPVHSGSKENESFYSYTPSGELRLEVLKAESAAMFIPGKEYYIDITLAE